MLSKSVIYILNVLSNLRAECAGKWSLTFADDRY